MGNEIMFAIQFFACMIPALIICWLAGKFDWGGPYSVDKATDTCPLCEGDGRGEGWQTGFNCDRCGGDGKFHEITDSDMLEYKRQQRQSELQNKNWI